MEFTCAKPNCGKSFVRLGGWKNHMSRVHGGWDESDVAQVTSGGTGSEDSVQSRMQSFAESLSPDGKVLEMPQPDGEVGAGSASASTERQSPAPPPIPPVKTIKATPKKLKKILASIPQTILENTGITLDDEDKEALEEAGEFLSDIFGVEFEVDQQKQTLHSKWWALVWVGGVAVMIYCKHRFADVWKQLYEMYKKKAAEREELGV
jgi:hypothetical protein